MSSPDPDSCENHVTANMEAAADAEDGLSSSAPCTPPHASVDVDTAGDNDANVGEAVESPAQPASPANSNDMTPVEGGNTAEEDIFGESDEEDGADFNASEEAVQSPAEGSPPLAGVGDGSDDDSAAADDVAERPGPESPIDELDDGSDHAAAADDEVLSPAAESPIEGDGDLVVNADAEEKEDVAGDQEDIGDDMAISPEAASPSGGDMKDDLGSDGEEASAGLGPDSPPAADGEGETGAASLEDFASGSPSSPPAAEANADLVDPEVQNNLIANIFGDSDDEDGDFLGFDVGAMEATKRNRAGDEEDSEDDDVVDPGARRGHSTAGLASDDDDEGVIDEDRRAQPNAGGMSDFDLMMERKKAGRKKRKKKGDMVSGMDDYVHSFIREMRAASDEDRRLNDRQQAATKKLKLLPSVLRCLNQVDLMAICLDLGVLPVVAAWLSPLPDGSLPHASIRDGLLAWLCMLPEIAQHHLKTSNIGRAVMFLYRHPKETRQNRQRAGSLISSWSRMIFGLQANYKVMSRDEREERDYMHMQRQGRRDSTDDQDDAQKKSGLLGESGQALRPGDRGFVGRARVPTPSNKDYIVRPKYNVDKETSHKEKKEPNRFEKQQLKHKQQKQVSKIRRAANVSLVGTKMSL